MEQLGKNITSELKGTILTITIDISKRLGSSASGKSETVASTSGNIKVPGTDVSLGINAYVKK